jgi:hypothetical protein
LAGRLGQVIARPSRALLVYQLLPTSEFSQLSDFEAGRLKPGFMLSIKNLMEAIGHLCETNRVRNLSSTWVWHPVHLA